MAFLSIVIKAIKIEKAKTILEDEKVAAIAQKYGKYVKLNTKYRHFFVKCYHKIGNFFKRCCSFPEGTRMHRICFNIRHDDSCENFTVKSIIGFISGFLLTYILFLFFVFQLNIKLSAATIMCSIFGCILTLGLAFSYKVRAIVFLILPQIFSKRGRQALLAYAFILAITGPAKNTLNNMSILSESLACGQEQLKSAVKQIYDVIKKPFYAVKDAIKKVVVKIKEIVKKLKQVFITIKRIVMSILRVIKAAFKFLWKIVNICNKELGTPFQRCSRVFENAIDDCNAKLGPFFRWMCSITYLVKSVCYTVKLLDYVCMLVDFISGSVIGVVVRKIKVFIRHIKTMFYVRIKFSHSFSFQTSRSKSMNEIAQGILTEIKERTMHLMTIFDLMTCATSLFFTFIIFNALRYRHKFLTSERFDNRYINKYFRNIDLKRAQLERDTVLPLNHREKQLYISVHSCKLVNIERRKLARSAMILLTVTIKLCTHMVTDYSLYWILCVIRYHGRFQSNIQSPNSPKLHVTGDGFLAQLLRSIVNAFQPVGVQIEIDTIPCLPDPIPPDYDRYVQIASLILTCWILTFAEPYGLRMRHSIMCYYHPTRAKQRAIWLYNHIIRSRSSFLKFARRQLRRKVMGDKTITKITCMEYFRARLPYLRYIFGAARQSGCLLCGEIFRESDEAKPIKCMTPGCEGIYCERCYIDLQNLCTVCLSPVQYGDLSDISEERDSSDESVINKKRKQKKKKTKKIMNDYNNTKKDDDDGDDDDNNDEPGPNTKLLTSDSSSPEDSDYKSDYSTSTQYSYGYQDNKDITSSAMEIPDNHFVDIEKQNIPDYASMEAFHDYENKSEISPEKLIIRKEDVDGKVKKPIKIKKKNVAIKSKKGFFSGKSSSSARRTCGSKKKKRKPTKRSIVARMWRRQQRNKPKNFSSSSSSLISDLKQRNEESLQKVKQEETEGERERFDEDPSHDKDEKIMHMTLYNVSLKNNPLSYKDYEETAFNDQSKTNTEETVSESTKCAKLKKRFLCSKLESSKVKSKRFWKLCNYQSLKGKKRQVKNKVGREIQGAKDKLKQKLQAFKFKKDDYYLESDTSITDCEHPLLANVNSKEDVLESSCSSYSMNISPQTCQQKSPKVPVPKLNLSFLNSQKENYPKSNYPGNRFYHIQYRIEDETPKSSSKSKSEFTTISSRDSLIRSQDQSQSVYDDDDGDDESLLRSKTEVSSTSTAAINLERAQRRPNFIEESSSEYSYTQNKKYQNKVRRYYKSLGSLESDSEILLRSYSYEKPDTGKRFNFIRFFKQIFKN